MLSGKTIEEKIWNYFTANGLNEYGTAGLMGNLYAESGLIPTNLQDSSEKQLGITDAEYTAAVDSGRYKNFESDGAGYGLAQWTYPARKKNLHDFCKSRGSSIGDLEAQLCFLIKELTESYKNVLAILRSATSVRQASDVVLLQYECPANKSDAVQRSRAENGQAIHDRHSKNAGATASAKIKTAAQLAQRAADVAKKNKTLYVMGCFGAPLTDANKARYCGNHTFNAQAYRTAMIKAASPDTFGFDCVNLIKGLLWGWTGNINDEYGGARYKTNGVPDVNANGMINLCTHLSEDFTRIEIGEAVWLEGHIGIYIGGGLAVECTPAWANKVQITACNCQRTGYYRRNWVKHGRLPYVTYTGKTENVAGDKTTGAYTTYKVKAGDTLSAIAKKHSTTYQVLAKYNGITNPNVIRVGQIIKIPKGGITA